MDRASCACKPRLTPRQTSLHAARSSRPLGPGDHGPPIGTGEAAPPGVGNLPSAVTGELEPVCHLQGTRWLMHICFELKVKPSGLGPRGGGALGSRTEPTGA